MTGENWSNWIKTCPSSTLPTNPMCTGWDLKPGLQCKWSVTNNMNHGMTPQKLLFEHPVPRLTIEFQVLPNTIQQYSPPDHYIQSSPQPYSNTHSHQNSTCVSYFPQLHMQVLQCEGTHCATICNAVCPEAGSWELGPNSKWSSMQKNLSHSYSTTSSVVQGQWCV